MLNDGFIILNSAFIVNSSRCRFNFSRCLHTGRVRDMPTGGTTERPLLPAASGTFYQYKENPTEIPGDGVR